MPRATRSKKILIVEDDTALASQVPLPDTPSRPRPALAEISHNLEEEVMTVEDAEMAAQLKGLKAAYKTAIGAKSRKGKGKKKFKEQLEMVITGSSQEVVDDQQPAAVSLAIAGARQMLSSDEGSLMFLLRGMTGLDLTNSEETPSAKEGRRTPPSPAVRETRQRLKKTNEAGLQKSLEVGTGADAETSESPTKAGITTLDAVEKACEGQASGGQPVKEAVTEDSFVEEITSRSPAKPVPRIEDSVEAIDKLEEAIEALGEAAVAVSPRRMASPTDRVLNANAKARVAKAVAKPFSSLRVKPKENKRNLNTLDGVGSKGKDVVKKARSFSTLRDSVSVSDGKVTVTKKPVKRPASLLPPKEPVKSTKPATRPDFELPGEAVARRLKEQREARKAQREASDESSSSLSGPAPVVKVKSTKPPTKSTFELPGEALSRKKREALEARLKAQEEEEKKRREFKAKPLRKTVAPGFVPRETVASRARKSQVGIPESNTGLTGYPHGSLNIGKRGSIVGAHRPSILAANLANTSSPRAPGPAASAHVGPTRKASTTSGPSMSGLAMQRTVSASEVQVQRQRAKEIYNRDMKALENMAKEKREREEAAKKSRLEAAERGRQASREWAEKQRAKKAAEGDKGISPGFGPGGQMGLPA